MTTLCVVQSMKRRQGIHAAGLLADRAWLNEQYIIKGRSAGSIALELGCEPSSVWYRLRKFEIPRRPRGFQPTTLRIDEEGRECTQCGHYKPWSQYWKSSKTWGRGKTHTSKCVECMDPVAAKRNSRAHKLRRHHITEEQISYLIELDGDACALCGGSQQIEGADLDFDHDHECCPGPWSCGKCIRGRLCRSCNRLVGRVEAAGFTLEQLVAYLVRRPLLEEGSQRPWPTGAII
jgi:hypothetical protein